MPEPIAFARPDISEADVQAVADVVRSGRLALGPQAEAFERAVADYVGVGHAVAVSSGTAGLHLIVRALGIGPGDEVLVPSFTFAASVNALLYQGAQPVFVDIAPDTFNLDPADVERKITPRTRAIMAVDVFGHAAPWDELSALADAHGLLLIDDCCEAIGGTYRGRRLGSLGRAGVFAFYPNKQITTGEGGVIVTDDGELASACRGLRNQGRAAMGQWLTHERLGYNYRLDEMSAALGVSQFARLGGFLERRALVAAGYDQRLAAVPGVRPPQVRDGVGMSWFVYVVLLAEGLERAAVMGRLEDAGIPTRAYFSPVHRQPYLPKAGHPPVPLPVTDAVAQRTVALPFHNRLTAPEQDRVVSALAAAVALESP